MCQHWFSRFMQSLLCCQNQSEVSVSTSVCWPKTILSYDLESRMIILQLTASIQTVTVSPSSSNRAPHHQQQHPVSVIINDFENLIICYKLRNSFSSIYIIRKYGKIVITGQWIWHLKTKSAITMNYKIKSHKLSTNNKPIANNQTRTKMLIRAYTINKNTLKLLFDELR